MNPQGAIFFWGDEPYITGFLTIGKEHWELVGVRRSDIRTDFTGHQQPQEKQVDMFDERGSGDGGK